MYLIYKYCVTVTMPRGDRGRQSHSKARAPARRSSRAATRASTAASTSGARTPEDTGHSSANSLTVNPPPIAAPALDEFLQLVRDQVQAELHSQAEQVQRRVQANTSTPASQGTCMSL